MIVNTQIATDTQLVDTTTSPGQFVGVHVLRPVAAVNLNANQDGTPKTIDYGDARRLRVSSQARKRAMREWTHTFVELEEQAIRTRRVPGPAAKILAERRDVDVDEALNVICALLLGVGKFTITPGKPAQIEELAFVPRQTLRRLAQIADAHWDELSDAAAQVEAERAAAAEQAAAEESRGRGKRKKETLGATTVATAIKKQVVAAFAPGASSEIALNGRMLTALPDTGAVDSAGSVAHSLSVDPVRLLADEWTAADDWQDGDFDAGAAMLDTRTLASGTLYEWAALDRHQLRVNLAESSGLQGEELEAAAVSAERLFVSSAAWAVPSASSHSTGSVAAPALVVATVADTPPLSAAQVFETAITESATAEAAKRLADYLVRISDRRPINGGMVLWMPGLYTAPPTFPAALTVEG